MARAVQSARACCKSVFESVRLPLLHLGAPHRLVLPANARRPHHFRYKRPWFAIDEHHRRQDEPIFQEGRGSVDKIAVHHYVTKCDASEIRKETHGVFKPYSSHSVGLETTFLL